MTGALSHVRVLDLTRVLAGPICTQILGDMGADVIKIERPGGGDDTRSWGPPFLKDAEGKNTHESAYYLCANRNKRSVAIDMATPKGQDLIHRLLANTDILIENFKVGSLAKYGLSYDDLKQKYPRLIYCSITGFGQTGPLAPEPGYDFLAQGMSGFMAATGASDAPPTKAGVAIADYTTGLYAAIGILSALEARHQTGHGQHVDCALLDSTIALMTNVAQYYLTSGNAPRRYGNAHSTIVPYQDLETSDGHVIVAVGNDHQFGIFAQACGHPEWATDPRFITNTDRVLHREVLLSLIRPAVRTHTTDYWIKTLEAVKIPVGPILPITKVFDQPQVQAREMKIQMTHPLSPTPISLVGSAIKLNETPVSYRYAPPVMGADTYAVLIEHLGLSPQEIDDLKQKGIIA